MRRRRVTPLKKSSLFSPIRPKRPRMRKSFRIHVDWMNVWIVLVLGINIILLGSLGLRHCTPRREISLPIEPVETRIPSGEKRVSTGEIKNSVIPPKEISFQVEVLNGCGVPQIADHFTRFLREKKFDVVKTGNYENFNVAKTLVIDRHGNLKSCIELAEVLGLKRNRVIQETHSLYTVDATVILGKDFRTLSSWKILEARIAKKK